MKQLRFTTSQPFGMFSGSNPKPLINPDNVKDLGEVVMDKIKSKTAYIHGDAEDLAGFDIPMFLDGNLGQLELSIEEQDILMMLPTGEYPCISEFIDEAGNSNCYLLTLKK